MYHNVYVWIIMYHNNELGAKQLPPALGDMEGAVIKLYYSDIIIYNS